MNTVLEGYEEGDKVLIHNYIIHSKTNNYLEEARGRLLSKMIQGYLIPATIIELCDNLK